MRANAFPEIFFFGERTVARQNSRRRRLGGGYGTVPREPPKLAPLTAGNPYHGDPTTVLLRRSSFVWRGQEPSQTPKFPAPSTPNLLGCAELDIHQWRIKTSGAKEMGAAGEEELRRDAFAM